MATVLAGLGNILKWTFIIGGTAVAITTVCLVKTKPSKEHFKKKLASNTNGTNTKGFIKKCIDKTIECALELDCDFEYQDWLVFATMSVKSSEYEYRYIGILNNWFPLRQMHKGF